MLCSIQSLHGACNRTITRDSTTRTTAPPHHRTTAPPPPPSSSSSSSSRNHPSFAHRSPASPVAPSTSTPQSRFWRQKTRKLIHRIATTDRGGRHCATADAIASIDDDDRTSLGDDDDLRDGVPRDDDDDDDDRGRGARAIARATASPTRDLHGEPTRDARQGGVSVNVTKRWCA